MADSSSNKETYEVTGSNLKNGPLTDRGCTDLLCCLLFTITFVALFGIGIYCFSVGQPKYVYTPMDPDGNFCGLSDKSADYPFIYFVAPSSKTMHRTTCVKECPTDKSTTIECLVNKEVTTCAGVVVSQTPSSVHSRKTPNRFVRDILLFDMTNKIKKQRKVNMHEVDITTNYETAILIYPSVKFAGVCLPKLQQYLDQVKETLYLDSAQETVQDLQATWTISLACAGIALVLGFIFMVMTRFCAKVIVWSFIVLSVLSLVLAGVFFLNKAGSLGSVSASGSNWSSSDSVIAQTEDSNQESSKYTYYTFGIIFLVIAAILFVCVCCLYRRIKLAVAIIQSAALFVADNPLALLIPVLSFVTMLIWIIFFVLGAIFILGTGEVTNNPKHLPFGNFQISQNFKYIFYFYLIGCLWVFAFLIHTIQFILGLSTSFWYFERRQKITAHPVIQSVKWLFRYHVGTVAMGSGIITGLFVIKITLQIMAHQQKASGNKFMEYLAKCCACLVDCFQRFIQWLSKNAYFYCGMTGTGFCSSAWKVFQLILHNPLRFAVTGFLGEIFQFFGEMFICLLTALCGWLIITKSESFSNLSSVVAPTILFAIIGAAVGALFMTVYGTVADALLIVFVMDEEIMHHHFGGNKPNDVPAPLNEFIKDIEEHNK